MLKPSAFQFDESKKNKWTMNNVWGFYVNVFFLIKKMYNSSVLNLGKFRRDITQKEKNEMNLSFQ